VYFACSSYNQFQEVQQFSCIASADIDECRRISRESEEYVYAKSMPIVETWDGKDFNRFSEDEPAGPMGYTLCSRRVLDLAARDKWTNILFAPLDRVHPFRIDHLNGPWPLESFNSKYEPQ